MQTAGGNLGGYHPETIAKSSTVGSQDGNITMAFKNDMERLHHDLLIKGNYGRSLRPVRDPKDITSVILDVTIRQIMDLDEKNQVLKAYFWIKQRWTDEFLMWNETQYDGIEDIWLPTHQLWRPDIVIYEDTAQRDFNPKLPYFRISHEGKVTVSEPLILETTCSVDILFFPFDFQRCSFTFTSWLFPSDRLDIFSANDGHSMMEKVERYFLPTGEWTISDVTIVKSSENFGMLQEELEHDEEDDEEEHETKTHHDEPGDHHGTEEEGYHEGEIPPVNTSNVRKITLGVNEAVEDVYPDRITSIHWTDIKFTFVLKRNSALYMQSMLFPAILLTTVALLGFFLPPDSGERIGLQITILLTFMVFLLTVGEMFPASTGPFLGVYYVLCMVLLGVNLLMTVLVLHLHYMPSAAVIGINQEGEIFIKDVPRWALFLLRIAKYKFSKKGKFYNSPTSNVVRGIIKTGRIGTKIPKQSKVEKPESKNGVDNFNYLENGIRIGHHQDTISSIPYQVAKSRVSPAPAAVDCRNTAQVTEQVYKDKKNLSKNAYSSIQAKVDKIKHYLEFQNDQMKESNMGDDVEKEWKAMSRTIDNLCMKVYLAILVISHVIILATALIRGANFSHEGHHH